MTASTVNPVRSARSFPTSSSFRDLASALMPSFYRVGGRKRETGRADQVHAAGSACRSGCYGVVRAEVVPSSTSTVVATGAVGWVGDPATAAAG
ncbi:hypothetical protein Kisp01_11950 [Kineosporia sp. NBRC 101677]|nr:hypothetical protein Kisp01_11950 [Kineosporia sp. NBRC 101677]